MHINDTLVAASSPIVSPSRVVYMLIPIRVSTIRECAKEQQTLTTLFGHTAGESGHLLR